ncbi:RagB/SusD family nutrient uptake outer membrane protein [Saccharicrinis aurantiacus]|uniref:RagB/SusD family nutrient uptake outer membrane protein n=1 Tax=Saccharicrinis aurantiacus TaxID=1849719 RepID=UPI00095011E0|nr:RagB/SusD family nutrient uptake outer membrane protein [Saccharicrinis aurantiacus]
MKKIIKYTLGVALAVSLLSSCEDKLLDQDNPNAITTDTFWQSESDFEKAQNALYSSLQFNNVCGGGTVPPMSRSDFGSGETWMGTYPWNNIIWNDATEYVERRWSELYIGVFRANQILHYIQDVDFYTEDEKNLIIAQARFLRALNYFWIVNDYGTAVIHEVLPIVEEDMHKPLSTMEEVYNVIIKPDLEFAMQHLPVQWGDKGDTGRFTWGAATALLGKAYLYNKEWEKAAAHFKLVIDKADNEGVYHLVDNFMDNFTDDNEFNSESILEVSYSDNYKEGVIGDRTDDVGDVTGAEAQTWANFLASIHVGGYNSLMPTYWLQELFVSGDEMDSTNPINNGRFVSSRSYATIVALAEKGDDNNWGVDGERYYNAPLLDTEDTEDAKGEKSKANFAYGQGSKVRKYINWHKKDDEDPLTKARSGINIRLIRLADVYLMYAEAILEGTGNTAEALKYIDKVRARAGVVSLQSYLDANGQTFPKLDKVKFANGLSDYEYVTMNSDNLLHHIRMVERPLELAFEGHRWYDLVRWGITSEVFNTRLDEENNIKTVLGVPDGTIDIPKENWRIEPLYLTERVRPSYGEAAANYSSEFHDYLPVPAIEKQSNQALQ